MALKKHEKYADTLKEEKFSTWSLVWGHYSELMKKLMKLTTHETYEATTDCAWLLKHIRDICHQTENTTHAHLTSLRLQKQLCNYEQQNYQTLLGCAEELKAITKTIESAL